MPLVFKPAAIFVDRTFSGRELQLASGFGGREQEVLFEPNTKWLVLKVVDGDNLEHFGEPVQRIVHRREIPTSST